MTPLNECTNASDSSGWYTTDVRPLGSFDHHSKFGSDFRTVDSVGCYIEDKVQVSELLVLSMTTFNASDFRVVGPRDSSLPSSSTCGVEIFSLFFKWEGNESNKIDLGVFYSITDR